jgi:hypothetical protein
MKRITLIRYTIFILIALSLFLQLAYWIHTGNFNSPIVPFEFAETKTDIKALFYINDQLQTDKIMGVDDQNIVDFFYMLSYTGLLILVFSEIKKQEHRILNSIGIILSCLILLSDALENLMLLNITEALLDSTGYIKFLGLLSIFTHIKWFGLSMIFVVLCFNYFKLGNKGKLYCIFSILPIIMSFLSFFGKNKVYDIYYAYSVMFAFIILIIRIFVSKFAEESLQVTKHTQV